MDPYKVLGISSDATDEEVSEESGGKYIILMQTPIIR